MSLITSSTLILLWSCGGNVTHDKFNNIKTFHLDSAFQDRIKSEFNAEYGGTSDFLGGLTPKYPIVKVKTSCGGSCDKDWWSKGMVCFCSSYVVKLDNQLKQIKAKSELRDLFAPIETFEEALSYSIIMTDNFPIFDKSFFKKEFTYFISDLSTTRVTEKNECYYVELFDYKFFGCGEHPYSTVLYQVNKDGQIKEIKRQKAFKNKKRDALCVD